MPLAPSYPAFARFGVRIGLQEAGGDPAIDDFVGGNAVISLWRVDSDEQLIETAAAFALINPIFKRKITFGVVASSVIRRIGAACSQTKDGLPAELQGIDDRHNDLSDFTRANISEIVSQFQPGVTTEGGLGQLECKKLFVEHWRSWQGLFLQGSTWHARIAHHLSKC